MTRGKPAPRSVICSAGEHLAYIETSSLSTRSPGQSTKPPVYATIICMSSPSYEIFFLDAPFRRVESLINTLAGTRQLGGRQCWIIPPEVERFDLLIERDDDDWDDFVHDDVDLEFFVSIFKNRVPSCSLYLEGRKWAGAQGVRTMRSTISTLLRRFDGLFATEDQLFTLDDLENAGTVVPISKVVDYRAIQRTDHPVTRKRIALGIRGELERHFFSDPFFEIGDEQTRKKLTDELVSLGGAAIPVIMPWLKKENPGLVTAGVEIIRRIGGEEAARALGK
jgi:hypothetical protein